MGLQLLQERLEFPFLALTLYIIDIVAGGDTVTSFVEFCTLVAFGRCFLDAVDNLMTNEKSQM